MKNKTIVTHISPDLDAIASSWLIKRYLPGWESADHAFVPAGNTLDNMKADSDKNIIHVDTGLGMFDHHQFSQRLSATKRVFEYLSEEGHIREKDFEAVERMVSFITEIDNFGEVNFPDPTDIRYSFCLHEMIYPLRGQLTSDVELMNLVMLMLDAILVNLKSEIKAEQEIQQGLIMKTSWGKTLVLETQNEVTVKHALKDGYELVVRKDPETNHVRIKTQPSKKYNLAPLYDKIRKIDPKATWFLHASNNMLLNGSSKNPDSVPSKLTVKDLVAIFKAM
ncbi:hypothetical protein KC726_03500 [Candidatus Woesebacteria bacterium]|nr:hypothetical protein [Candidatus Woesebacteria bacterium]